MRVRHRLLTTMTAVGFASALIVAAGSIWLIRTAVQDPFLERLQAETAFLAQEAETLGVDQAQRFALRAAEQGLGIHELVDGRLSQDYGRWAPLVAWLDYVGEKLPSGKSLLQISGVGLCRLGQVDD